MAWAECTNLPAPDAAMAGSVNAARIAGRAQFNCPLNVGLCRSRDLVLRIKVDGVLKASRRFLVALLRPQDVSQVEVGFVDAPGDAERSPPVCPLGLGEAAASGEQPAEVDVPLCVTGELIDCPLEPLLRRRVIAFPFEQRSD